MTMSKELLDELAKKNGMNTETLNRLLDVETAASAKGKQMARE